MASKAHLKVLEQGAIAWNRWRRNNPDVQPDLSRAKLYGVNLFGANLSQANLMKADLREAEIGMADLCGADLSRANLSGAELRGVDLREASLHGAKLRHAILHDAKLYKADFYEADLNHADLCQADLRGAKLIKAGLQGANLSRVNLGGEALTGVRLEGVNLREADLREADLSEVNLIRADLFNAKLNGANLSQADLYKADLSTADLRDANLTEAFLVSANLFMTNLSGACLSNTQLQTAQLVKTNLAKAQLSNCNVYGTSAWDLHLDGCIQTDLVVTSKYVERERVTVDNLEVAQLIYLLLNNEKLRDIIKTISTKAVLILGRFVPERKAVLDAIRNDLRKHDLLPILFDFDPASTRDTHETVTTLARMSRFVIADITDPKSIPQELVSIVEQLPSLPVQPILQNGHESWGMYDHIERYPWVLAIHRYRDLKDLITSLEQSVIAPAEEKAKELQGE